MNPIWNDLRYGLRQLGRSPGFTAVAILTLALGIGANTAIFSVVNRLLLSPLPFSQPDQLVTVWEHNLPRDFPRNVVSPGNFLEWRERAKSFDGIAAFSNWTFNLTGNGEPERVISRAGSANIFSLLGVTAAVGRTFQADEDQPGKGKVVMMSYGFWQRRFGGDSTIIGRSITLDGEPTIVVGVLPMDFEFFGDPADLWAPLPLALNPNSFKGRWLQVLGRLKSGVSLDAANAEMVALATRLREEHRDENAGWSANVVSLKETLVGDFRRGLLVLLGAVGLLLLIACANIAHLLLARAAGREKEIAIRTTLGATRRRLIGQLLIESFCLATMAGMAGLLVALWGVGIIRQALPADLRIPGFSHLGIDGLVLGFTFGVTLFTGILFGLAPALTVSQLSLHDPLRGSGRHSQTKRRARFRDLLVVTEVALAVVLLLGAGLLLRSFSELRRVDPGFQPRNLLEVRISLPEAKYADEKQQAAFFEQLDQRLATIHGVKFVGAISFLPLSGMRSASTFGVEGRPAPTHGEESVGDMRAVTPGYFEAMGIPIIKGRGLTLADRADAPSVTVVSETLARTMFPRQDPIGKRLGYGWGDSVSAEIVGVAGDVHHDGPSTAPYMEIYRPLAQFPYSFMSIVVRTDGEAPSITDAVRSEVHALDPDQPVAQLRPMQELMQETLAKPRLNTLLLSLFAVVGLTLAALGIYGLMSYAVAQRTQEIGIRMALGAKAKDVLAMIVRHGLALTLTGVAVGLVASLVLTQVMSRLLFGVSSRDPLTFVMVPVLLAVVALVSCFLPARRATRVDPIVALRSE